MNDHAKIRCFVIMPFSKTENHSEEYWTSHYEKYLKPLIEEAGDNIQVSRSEAARGGITSAIIMNLIESDILIADITDHNPNVFWELGVRHSFKHGTIIIAEEGTRIPFDIKDKGVLSYDTGHLNEENRKKIIQAVRDCCLNPEKADSPILETISGRGTLYELINKKNILKKIDGLIDELNTNELLLNNLIERMKNEEDLRSTYSLEFLTAAIDHFFVERYLDYLDLDASSYMIGLDKDEKISIYFVLWTIRRRIANLKSLVMSYDQYSSDYVMGELEETQADLKQIQIDLKRIENEISNRY